MTLMDQGRVIPPTTTPPSAVATAADAGAHAPSSAPPSRLQLPLPRGAPVVRGFAVSATPRPQQQPKPLAVNPYAAPRGSTSGPATLPPHQAGGPWSAPRAAFRFSEQAPPATVRHQQQQQQQQQQQREPAKNAMAVPPLSGSPQHPAAGPPQPVPVHRVHFGLAHPHTPYGGIFAHQPDPAAVKISSPPASPPQTVSKRPAYIMAN
ncbi:MAG: hypothetical protein BJ554DRAFT_5196 [Olpidium bornovanus]|uniref:Uncharacterized protein n=1 Tax=Olpidium bornovanus TaxID=278681 RepID=A0A8H7ZZT3_9FUNG|nr:MAG: hypothetical protein BJ554DRAFT_5196 [Olpidium bornovanus]